ncbi:MAG: PAS domain-containing sensor histidine kinase [Brevundimonas sp.]|nr:MAG: PAS domain-containing sensor histidine kinase [Brevundimonas sp.]
MTDTVVPAPMVPSPLDRWLSQRGPVAFTAVFIVSALIAATAIWLVAITPGESGQSGVRADIGRLVLQALMVNLILILGLMAAVIRRAWLLFGRRQEAGTRLHLRFVTLFSAVAVVPAVLVALVFGVLVNRGVDQWFSDNVQSTVENGADIGRAYTADVARQVDGDLIVIAGQLEGIRPVFENRIQFSEALKQIADLFGYPAIYILDANGNVAAAGELPGAPPYVAPPRVVLEEAEAGNAPSVQEPTRDPDAIRGVMAFPAYDDGFLYLVRPLQTGLIGQLEKAEGSIISYRDAAESRQRIQVAFALSYLETALLVLVGAIWAGMSAANAITGPIGRLIQAANRVSEGDLSARVDTSEGPDEISLLSQAFNRMTSDLEAQQADLRTASEDAVNRSRFIETVLSGVSAGVIGLDRKGRVSAVNESAIDLLGIPQREIVGRSLAKVSPELSALVNRSEAHVEEDIDITRNGETRRLRVRIEGGLGGEMVLTFDDITRLVTAQRNAAWRDVARRIAHEIKNPLTPIQLSAERLRRRYRSQVADDVDVFDRCTETIIRQVGDIGRMVDEFSSFARMPAPRFVQASPAELLREAVFAQRVAVDDIEVELKEPLPRVAFQADRQMVAQALTNILKNAGESVAARRAMAPRSDDVRGVGLRASLETSQSADGTALISFVVEDDGVGLPERDRDRLTEPYVTTRDKGTGLGLAIVKRICEDHGGELLLADAETLGGARISLVFPLKPRAQRGPESAGATAPTDVQE